jgi:hypothetical protein
VQSSTEKSQGKDVQYIIPLDEYHLFPKYAKEYLISKAKQSGIKTLFIKSTATPNSMDMLYKSLKKTTKTKPKKVVEESKSRIEMIQSGINEINYIQSSSVDHFISEGKKYHIIIDPSIKDSNLSQDIEAILKYWQKIASKNKQQTFVISKKNNDGDSRYYLFKDGKLVEVKEGDRGDRSKLLNIDQLKGELSGIDKEIKLIYPFCTATGGDLRILDFAGNTKITVKITSDMKNKYSATEMVDFIRQAVGRDRTFNWKDINSFNNVELNGITKQELEGILKKAENFENLEAQIKQGNYKAIDSANFQKLYCEKDIKKIKDFVFLRLKKPDLLSFDANQMANIFGAIEIFEEIYKKKDSQYEDIYAGTAKFYPNSFNIDGKKKFDAIFSLYKLVKFITPFWQSNQEGAEKSFVDKIIESYKGTSISKKAIINKLAGDEEPEVVIKKKIFNTKFNNSLEEAGLNCGTDDIIISNIELCINAQNNFDIKFDYNFSFNNDCAEKNEALQKLVKNHIRNKYQQNVKLSEIQEWSDIESAQPKQIVVQDDIDPNIDPSNNESFEEHNMDWVIPPVNNEKAKPGNSVEARVIVRLFENVLGDKDNKFTDENKKLINNFYFSSSSSPNKELSKEEKLQFVESALLQRNKYNENGGKNTDKDRSGKHYKALKETLQDLNEKNIKFTTESLKLFNVDNKTLGTRQEIDELIAKKPLFVRAMRKADINNFKLIATKDLEVNEPSNNILLAKPDGVASKSIRVKLMKLKYQINKSQ